MNQKPVAPRRTSFLVARLATIVSRAIANVAAGNSLIADPLCQGRSRSCQGQPQTSVAIQVELTIVCLVTVVLAQNTRVSISIQTGWPLKQWLNERFRAYLTSNAFNASALVAMPRPPALTLRDNVMVIAFANRWWTLAARGIAAILFGILTFISPGLSLFALVILFGAWALADGVFNLVMALRMRKGERWGWLVLE